jgi:hypothetical protein
MEVGWYGFKKIRQHYIFKGKNMKLPYPMLDILIFLLRLFGWVLIILAIFFYFSSTATFGYPDYVPLANEIYSYLKIYQLILTLLTAFCTFVIAELLSLGIDISKNTKDSSKQLENISNSLLERDKIIMKMMGIIVDQMKNK